MLKEIRHGYEDGEDRAPVGVRRRRVAAERTIARELVNGYRVGSPVGPILDGIKHGGHFIGAVSELQRPFEVGQDELRDAGIDVVLPAEADDVPEALRVDVQRGVGPLEIAGGQHLLAHVSRDQDDRQNRVQTSEVSVEGELLRRAERRPVQDRQAGAVIALQEGAVERGCGPDGLADVSSGPADHAQRRRVAVVEIFGTGVKHRRLFATDVAGVGHDAPIQVIDLVLRRPCRPAAGVGGCAAGQLHQRSALRGLGHEGRMEDLITGLVSRHRDDRQIALAARQRERLRHMRLVLEWLGLAGSPVPHGHPMTSVDVGARQRGVVLPFEQ